MLRQIWILPNENDFNNFNINDLNEFNSIILIDFLNKENLKDKIRFFEKMKKFSLPNCLKILISLGEEDFQEFQKPLEENEIEMVKTHKKILINFIKELLETKEKDIVKNINLRKELDIKTFYINQNSSKEKVEKSKNENEEIIDKSSDSYENTSFLKENDFCEKIFNLYNMLKNYNRDDIEKIFDLIDFLNTESQKLKDIIDNLPLITYKKKNEYFASYYYYIIVNLLRIYETYKPKNNENLGVYILLNDGEEGKDKTKETNTNEEIENPEKIAEIRECLEKKKNDVKNKFINIYKSYKKIMFREKEEELTDISKKISEGILITETLNKQLKEIEIDYLKLENILNNLKEYFNEFFRDYLYYISKFISSINNTYKYFYQKIIIDKCSDKENIEDFVDFIYYVSNYNYVDNKNSLNEIINYFEEYFSKKEYKEEKWKDECNNTFEIKSNRLNEIDWDGKKSYLDDFRNYSLNLITKNKLQKFQYINQKYLLFFKFRKNNILGKYKNVFFVFFQNIFKKEEMKKLMIKIFPILKNNYFINEDYVSEFFDKIKAYNFKPKDMCGETISPILDVFIKSYFDSSNLYESEVCVIASYIIIIFHEFSHYTRIYIYKTTGDSKYRKSIDLCQYKDIGEYFETLLFGKILLNINLLQALYILNEKNYSKNYETFKEEFLKCEGDDNIKIIYENLKEISSLLKSLNININLSNIKTPNTYFHIKSKSNYFVLGMNNDKKGMTFFG